jgi:hypothetical protein
MTATMTADPRRRGLMRQGFLFLVLALVLGLASNPGVAPPMPHAAVFFVILAVIVPSLFVSFGLVLYGMRGFAGE